MDNYSMLQTRKTFMALVDTLIPRTPELAYKYGRIQYFGALDLHTDEYMIWTLNYLAVPLASPIAETLNLAAQQLAATSFSALSDRNRLRVLNQLNQYSIISNLNSFTMMGYYSEWSGYGSSRLRSPNQRQLEFFPISWKQVGYPGPSLGYRVNLYQMENLV